MVRVKCFEMAATVWTQSDREKMEIDIPFYVYIILSI